MGVLIVLFVFFLSANAIAEMPVKQLKIAKHTFLVEVANTDAGRSQGLMFRESMGENNGMLFVFSETAPHSMWMMNTYIPLSVAFLDEGGVILNIADMMPQTVTAHHSAGPSKYAIEMNLGWFAARNIKPGARVTGLETVPDPE
jgi:uncharacterized membrane protein (UPF0127 family)